jgi:hypothetical protein
MSNPTQNEVSATDAAGNPLPVKCGHVLSDRCAANVGVRKALEPATNLVRAVEPTDP